MGKKWLAGTIRSLRYFACSGSVMWFESIRRSSDRGYSDCRKTATSKFSWPSKMLMLWNRSRRYVRARPFKTRVFRGRKGEGVRIMGTGSAKRTKNQDTSGFERHYRYGMDGSAKLGWECGSKEKGSVAKAKTGGGVMHEHNICRNSHRQYINGWEDANRVSLDKIRAWGLGKSIQSAQGR